MALQAVELVKEMVDMIVFGEPSEAAKLALEAAPSVKSAASKHAQIILLGGDLPSDEVAALNQSIGLLKAPSAQVEKVAATGAMSNTTKILLGGAGLAAVWFFFIRKS